MRLPYQKAEFKNDALVGTVVVLDSNYGNVWSNIPKALVTDKFKDVRFVKVKILKGQKSVYDGTVELVNTFNDVKKGQSLAYYNSLLNFSLALNMDNFAKKYGIESGPDWSIRITRGK